MPPTPKERVRIAVAGGRADRAPIVPIYDIGYVYRSVGADVREYTTGTAARRIEVIEANFRRHPQVDGIFVHAGTNDAWAAAHTVERLADYWLVTHRASGRQYRLLPDGLTAAADGTRHVRNPSRGGVSAVQSRADLERLLPRPPTTAEIVASGRFGPLAHLVARYPDHHFSFQLGSPMVGALGHCGGYEEGLLTMKRDRALFAELLARCAEHEVARIAPGAAAGAHSVWFTSYYTGADTIAPRDYAELVWPHERTVCAAARAAGLLVLNWFLGDLMPILDHVVRLPLDALVLEQGRKGYTIDPVAIRARVGPRFCLFGFGDENDYCEDARPRLAAALARQFAGAGRDGAFVVGTPIMPPNARPAAVDFYFDEARRVARY